VLDASGSSLGTVVEFSSITVVLTDEMVELVLHEINKEKTTGANRFFFNVNDIYYGFVGGVRTMCNDRKFPSLYPTRIGLK